MDLKDKGVKIINDGSYLVATMPNGEIIPMQVTCVLKDDLDNRGNVLVKVTLQTLMPLEDFDVIKSENFKPMSKDPESVAFYKDMLDEFHQENERLRNIIEAISKKIS